LIAGLIAGWQEGNDAIAQVSVVLLQGEGFSDFRTRLARTVRNVYEIGGKRSPDMGDRSIRGFMARIVCALALVMFGFAGHGLAATDDGPFAAQYRLPDGSFASLCQNGDDHTGTPPHARHHCDFCFASVGHAFVPPQPTFGPAVTAAEAGILLPVSAAAPKFGALRHGLCRGPPPIV
jgi:hypothetical protein